MRHSFKAFIMLMLIMSSVRAENLLDNPGFEVGMDSWSGTATLSDIRVHGGASAAFLDSGSDHIEQVISVSPDSSYRLICWVFLDSAFSGNDWGGVSISAVHYDWSGEYSSEFLTPGNRPVGVWFQEFIELEPTYPQLRVRAAMFGGGGWQPRFYIDDVSFAPEGEVNNPPLINFVDISPTAGSAPLSVYVSADVSDSDGGVRLLLHDFGDGSNAIGANANHVYGTAGEYPYTLTAVDDQGLSATWQQLISVSEHGAPFVQIDIAGVGDSIIVSDSVITIGGVMSAIAASALWINNRTSQSGAIVVNTDFTTPQISLLPGENRIDVQAWLSDGMVRGDYVTVYYDPPDYSGPVVTQIAVSQPTVGQYELWELEFEVKSIATTPTLPYDADTQQNLKARTGLTVDASFSNGIETLRWPAFLKARTLRHNGRFIPTGDLVWCVRASFKTPGVWSCMIEAEDAGGTTLTTAPSVFVTESDNAGFIQASDNDNRYFEYDSGEMFLPLGFGFPLQNADQIDSELRLWRDNGINFSRLWLSSHSPFSDPWCSFATHHSMANNGYMPPSLLTTTEHLADGDASWMIGAPPVAGVRTPAIFRGFWDGPVAVLPNRTYRVSVRLKTVDVLGAGGVVAKIGGWLGEQAVESGVGQVVTPYLRGSNNWCYLQGEFNTGAAQYELPYLYIALEDVESGLAYIDQVLLQEVLSDGRLAQNILSKPNANSHCYMDPYRSLDFDHLIEAACTTGVYFKLVISEKDDWLLNQFDDQGFVNPFDGRFETARGSKTRRLMEYYWRHLIARWGYAVSVHSWELVNEGAPNSFLDLTNHLCETMHQQSPYRRMATTSFWSGWYPDYWTSSAADYGDVHAYIMTTGWINSITIDGLTYDREMLKEDPAAALYAYSMQIGSDPNRTKPVVIAETDLDMPGDQSPDPRLALDTEGLWLHDFVWGHIAAGGVSALIWNNSNILSNDLHDQFKPFSEFMRGVRLHKENYRDIGASTSTAVLRVWGQRNGAGNRAHAWIKNRLHTWARVQEQGGAAPISGDFTIPGLRPGVTMLRWFDTSTGDEFSADTIIIGSDSIATISIENLQNDLGLKIESLSTIEQYIDGVTIFADESAIILRWPTDSIPCSYRIWRASDANTPFADMILAATISGTSWTEQVSRAMQFYVVERVPN